MTPNEVLLVVCGMLLQKPEFVTSEKRHHELMLARHLWVYILRSHYGMGVREIARLTGKADFSVRNSVANAEDLIVTDRRFREAHNRALLEIATRAMPDSAQ